MKKLIGLMLVFMVMSVLAVAGMATASTSAPPGTVGEITMASFDAEVPPHAMACLACEDEILIGPSLVIVAFVDYRKGSSIAPTSASGLHNSGQTYLPDIAA